MDQNSGNDTEKRNWRERLGIGAGKDMPRIADEFAPAPAAAKAAVRPAPMAPRPGVKAAPPRAATAAPAPEKLAEKLKAQRDAQERLAEQRVQAARQRAEVQPDAGKPKFTFAVEEAKVALPVPPMPKPKAAPPPQQAAAPRPQTPQRTVVPPPTITTPPLTPPRQPLGGERPMMPARAPIPPPVVPTRPQQRYSPPPATSYAPTQSYNAQVPPYRPMEPTGRGYGAGSYAPPPPYVPPVGGYNNQPRLSVPPAVPAGGGYGADAYDTRARNLRPPARPSANYREDFADQEVFADPRGQRRATANEYSQAYRDEQGYDEDLPPSRGPWVPLAMLLLLAMAVGGGFYYFWNISNAPVASGQSSNTPVVEAPAQPAKVTPDPAQTPQGQPTKKLIYDRIVGDREVLGGDVIESEEVPAQPGDATNLQPGEQGGEPVQAQPTGQEDLVPLPLPPPPGDNGSGDQQGSLPSSKTSNEAMILPAASESQAAVPSQDVAIKSDPEANSTIAKSELPTPPTPVAEAAPVPGETEQAVAATGGEIISDPEPVEPAPPPKKKVAEAKPKKPVVKKVEKSLGAEPVVLVPPSAVVEQNLDEPQVASIDSQAATVGQNGGLYDGGGVVDPAPSVATTPAPAKKKKTLADLFRGENDNPAPAAEVLEPEPQPAPAPAKKVQAAPAPVPQQQASAGGYVVQLASFPNQGDASKEYSRLKARHGAALSGLTPIVSQAVVGGSTRYRLAVGVMSSRAEASAVCAKLFAAGEPDCLVRRQ